MAAVAISFAALRRVAEERTAACISGVGLHRCGKNGSLQRGGAASLKWPFAGLAPGRRAAPPGALRLHARGVCSPCSAAWPRAFARDPGTDARRSSCVAHGSMTACSSPTGRRTRRPTSARTLTAVADRATESARRNASVKRAKTKARRVPTAGHRCSTPLSAHRPRADRSGGQGCDQGCRWCARTRTRGSAMGLTPPPKQAPRLPRGPSVPAVAARRRRRTALRRNRWLSRTLVLRSQRPPLQCPRWRPLPASRRRHRRDARRVRAGTCARRALLTSHARRRLMPCHARLRTRCSTPSLLPSSTASQKPGRAMSRRRIRRWCACTRLHPLFAHFSLTPAQLALQFEEAMSVPLPGSPAPLPTVEPAPQAPCTLEAPPAPPHAPPAPAQQEPAAPPAGTAVAVSARWRGACARLRSSGLTLPRLLCSSLPTRRASSALPRCPRCRWPSRRARRRSSCCWSAS